MGLALLAALIPIFFVLAASLLAIGTSASRCSRVPLYWITAVLSSVVLPLLFSHPHQINSTSEYSALAILLSRAFTIENAFCFVGAIAAFLLARHGSEGVRFLSGVSWGLTVLFAVQLLR